jgi:hypothetical protein
MNEVGDGDPSTEKRKDPRVFGSSWLSLFALLVFFKKSIHQHFDYTALIALGLIDGHMGLRSRPPSWLNEMMPLNGGNLRHFAVAIGTVPDKRFCSRNRRVHSE